MIQASFAGKELNNILTINDLTFYEPGYTMLSPLELIIGEADNIYMAFRKRDETNLDVSNFNLIAKDASSGEVIETYLGLMDSSNIYYQTQWEESTDRLLGVISANSLISPFRIRNIECTLTDITDNNFINFNIICDTSNIIFHYLTVTEGNYNSELFSSIVGEEAIINLDGDGSKFLLLSPLSKFVRASQDESNFSYPLETTYYKRDNILNDEDFSFTISNFSHSAIENNVSITHVPQYPKVGLLLVDKYLQKELEGINGTIYCDIEARGQVSEAAKVFRVYFKR